MRITELVSVTGINVDLQVVVKTTETGSRSIPVQIECPNFQPKRICFDGEWRDIVPV